MHLPQHFIGYAILAATAIVIGYTFLRGPRQLSESERNSYALFYFSIFMMFATIGALIGIICLALLLILKGI